MQFNKSPILLTSVLIYLLILPIGSVSAQSLLQEEENKVFEVVEDPPIPWLYKTKCMDVDYTEKHDCYRKELAVWMVEELKYPTKALKERTEGMVVIQFIIDKSGAIRDAIIMKEIGNGCGDAALSVVNKMPDWVAGRQRGVPVNVRYSLPVKFKIGP